MGGIALCYVRKSLVRLASDEISPARQRAVVVAEAHKRSWDVALFEDAHGHRSGRNENRPGWIDLKAHLDDPGVTAVIVESLSRASRSMRDLFVFIGELDRRGIALISLKENIDATTSAGRAFMGVIATLNQFESDIASERMKATIAFKRDTRLQHWGYVPFGCARTAEQKLTATTEGVWRICAQWVAGNAERAPFAPGASARPAAWFGYADAVRACFEIYADADIGFVNLAEQMNRAGYRYRDRHGAPREFHTDDVRRIIEQAEVYAGHSIRRGKGGADRVVRDTHAPIVARNLVERVIERRRARKTAWGHGGGGRAKRVYLLVNVYCAECGAHLIGNESNGIRYYRHGAQIKRKCTQTPVRADVLEQAALDQLAGFTAPDEMKTRIAQRARDLAKHAATPALDAARRAVAETSGKLERLNSLFIDGQIDQAEYKRRRAKLEQAAREAEQTLRASPANPHALEALLAQVDRIADIVRSGAPEHQRAVLHTIFARHEARERKLVKTVVHEWARPFFNGSCNARGEKI